MTLRDRLVNRRTGEAMVSPSALLLAGGGVAVGLVAGLPVLAAAGLGAVAWAARVALAVPKGPRTVRLDPRSLPEPWRGFVQSAIEARDRFDRNVATMEQGPLRDRMAVIGARIRAGVDESWRIAQRGAQIDQARASLDIESSRAELAQLRSSGETGEAADRTTEALEAQLASADRMEAVVREARDRLRIMDARLDELVARAVEVSVSAGDTTDPLLAGDVDGLVQEMESLRLALEETRRGGPLDDPGRELRGGGGALPPPGPST